jgi:hypothetical protein
MEISLIDRQIDKENVIYTIYNVIDYDSAIKRKRFCHMRQHA